MFIAREKKTTINGFDFLLASSPSDHGSKYNSNRKHSYRSNEEPALSNNVDKTMTHIMANGVREKTNAS
jgi:hypothetical protein